MIKELEKGFTQKANPEHGKRQHAYMRCLFPFMGLDRSTRTEVQKPLFKKYPPQDEKELEQLLNALWKKEHREYQYTALDLAERFKGLATSKFLSAYEKLIRTKSWWDTVDDIAANLVGMLILEHPELKEMMDQWVQDENLWIRRTALIFQLKWKDQTDTKRLFRYCEKTMHESDFFIRKAIGWALRQYSKTDPQSVKHFIVTNKNELSPLSIKEGSKYV